MNSRGSLLYVRGIHKPRDQQRQRLYNAEREAFGAAWGAKLGAGTLAEAQAYVDTLCRARWFQSRFGQRRIEVQAKHHGAATGHYATHLRLPGWARCAPVIVHEVAHVLCSPTAAGHGPEFAALYLLLVQHALGDDAAKKLREAFARHRVTYRPGVPTLPKAGTGTVVTQEAARLKKREAAARPVTIMEARVAADVLKRAVKAGMLGATGTKQRHYALSAARRLEAEAATGKAR